MRLVDADELINAIADFPYGYRGMIKNVIAEQPTVEERKKGKWITEPYDLESDVWAHRCSNCLKVAMLGGNDINLNFCPNCGADMRGEQSVSDK